MLEPNVSKIRWAPRLRPILLKRLYEADAKGLRDSTLVDEVGTYLYARCKTFHLVHRGEVRCPDCDSIFEVAAEGTTNCPAADCNWRTTHDVYWKSIGNHYAWTGRAFDAYSAFLKSYPTASTYQQKMLLVDQLIHSFHLDDSGSEVKSVASKLLEGNKKEVVRFLDTLSSIDSDAKGRWRQRVSRTIDAREIEPK